MVDIIDDFKDKIQKKKTEKLEIIRIEDEVADQVDAPIEEASPTNVIQLGKIEESTSSNVVQLSKKDDDIALVAPVNVPQRNTKMINLTKTDYAVEAPVVIQNTGSFSEDQNVKQVPPVVVTETEEPKPWLNKELVAKAILFVTFTSMIADAIMGVYNVGLNGLLLLIAVSAIIQFLLVAEYRKPTMH